MSTDNFDIAEITTALNNCNNDDDIDKCFEDFLIYNELIFRPDKTVNIDALRDIRNLCERDSTESEKFISNNLAIVLSYFSEFEEDEIESKELQEQYASRATRISEFLLETIPFPDFRQDIENESTQSLNALIDKMQLNYDDRRWWNNLLAAQNLPTNQRRNRMRP